MYKIIMMIIRGKTLKISPVEWNIKKLTFNEPAFYKTDDEQPEVSHWKQNTLSLIQQYISVFSHLLIFT